MITITKSQGILTADQVTCVRLQEIIVGAKAEFPVGKVLIDAEKITYYKFNLKMGITRHSVSGIVYNNGNLSYKGTHFPVVRDTTMLQQLLLLFNLI